jgi:hypothetical protein
MPEMTQSTREAARRIGVTETALRKAEARGRIAREPGGQWDVDKTRRRMVETADPARSPLAGGGMAGGGAAGVGTGVSADATPYARLKVAQLALKVEAQRLALDEEKGRLLDAASANAAIDEIAGAMRDALLNWPARVSGLIAAEIGCDPHLVQTVLQQHMTDHQGGGGLEPSAAGAGADAGRCAGEWTEAAPGLEAMDGVGLDLEGRSVSKAVARPR